MRCPKCNTLMNMTHMMYIEECLHCGHLHDVFHDKEVDRGWVYGDGYPDDEETEDYEDEEITDEEYERLETAAFGGHKDVWIEVDGHQQRVLGDPNMSEETKQALAGLIKAATEAVERGDFDSDEGDGLHLCEVCHDYECQWPATKCWRCRQQEMIDKDC